MSIEIRTPDDDEQWNDLLSKAPSPSPFHLAETLDVFADHSNTVVHRLVGFKGEEPVGLFPVFTMEKGPFTAAFSPPPNLKVPYLGPVLVNVEKLKQRRRDRRHRRFIDAALDWLDDGFDPQYTILRTVPGYDDIRPFLWEEFDAKPRYTYVIDLDRAPDDIIAAFSADARRNITDDYDVDYEILEGDRESVVNVFEQVRRRHAEQGESFPVGSSFATDLYDTLPDGVLRPYVCRVDGEFVGGTVNIEFGKVGICWVGGAKTDGPLPVNDIVDWEYCLDAMERGVTAYDLAGANNPRLSTYKSKFAPELTPYYRLKKGTWSMNTATKLYNWIK